MLYTLVWPVFEQEQNASDDLMETNDSDIDMMETKDNEIDLMDSDEESENDYESENKLDRRFLNHVEMSDIEDASFYRHFDNNF